MNKHEYYIYYVFSYENSKKREDGNGDVLALDLEEIKTNVDDLKTQNDLEDDSNSKEELFKTKEAKNLVKGETIKIIFFLI